MATPNWSMHEWLPKGHLGEQHAPDCMYSPSKHSSPNRTCGMFVGCSHAERGPLVVVVFAEVVVVEEVVLVVVTVVVVVVVVLVVVVVVQIIAETSQHQV